MILYDESAAAENSEGVNDHEDSVDINETLQKLQESIMRLNENLEKDETEEGSEELTEEITEEITTEEISEEEMPVQKKDIQSLEKSIDNVGESIDKIGEYIDNKQRSDEEAAAVERGTHLTFLDETVDHHLYLTSEVENANINDLYTMTLSVRNVLLLAFLIFLSLGLMKLVRSALERLMNR